MAVLMWRATMCGVDTKDNFERDVERARRQRELRQRRDDEHPKHSLVQRAAISWHAEKILADLQNTVRGLNDDEN